MIIKIISVGKVKDRNLSKLIAEFTQRIGYDAKIELREIKDSDVVSEEKKLLKILEKETGYVFALGEEGNEYTSEKFANKLQQKESLPIIFVIGGPFGLGDGVKQKVNEMLALSQMTFTHEMAKLFLVEQIYRAISIILNRKYHK